MVSDRQQDKNPICGMNYQRPTMASRRQNLLLRPRSRSPSPHRQTNGHGVKVNMKVKKTVEWLLAMGFSVQGFRCFPWMAVNFFLKDGLCVSPSALQILMNSANLPMIGKPLYGILSDAVSINGDHRLPYVAIGALLQAISWLTIVSLPRLYLTVTSLTILLILGNLGVSITEVANDAMVAEAGNRSRTSGHLQSFVWTFTSLAGILGNLLGGFAVSRFSPTTMFLFYGLMLIVQLLSTISISETSLNLPRKTTATVTKSLSIRKQISELYSVLSIPEISHSIAWFSASFAVIPILMGTMFYYQTEYLKLDSSVIGLSKVFGQAYVLGWSLTYNRWLKEVPPRKLLPVIQVSIVVLMMSDIVFVAGIYRAIGVSDSVYVVVISGLLEVLVMQFKVLPFIVHIAQMCPVGCEGSLMAFVMSATAVAMIVSGYFGVLLANIFGVSDKDFSGFMVAIFVQAVCAGLPVFWSNYISDDSQRSQFKMR